MQTCVSKENAKAYSSHHPDELIIRDRLALDRTVLANERTILAYIRTSLVLFGGGVTLIKLFPGQPIVIGTGYMFIGIAVFTFFFGFTRFIAMHASLKSLQKNPNTHVE